MWFAAEEENEAISEQVEFGQSCDGLVNLPR